MPHPTNIESVHVMAIQARLRVPVVFGQWVMREREFALVRVRLQDGVTGYTYGLTRDGAVVEQIRKTIAPVYVDTAIEEREATFRVAWRRSLPSHSSGVGHRALSLVDLAAWDAAGKSAGLSIARMLGGTNRPMPITAIIGFPPSLMGPEETGAQTAALATAGWQR